MMEMGMTATMKKAAKNRWDIFSLNLNIAADTHQSGFENLYGLAFKMDYKLPVNEGKIRKAKGPGRGGSPFALWPAGRGRVVGFSPPTHPALPTLLTPCRAPRSERP
jgi:hypothetical protein